MLTGEALVLIKGNTATSLNEHSAVILLVKSARNMS
jgi:hypothetical protein